MARLRRIKVKDSDAYYHVMSRTVGQEFLLQNSEKDKFIEIMFDLSKLFFVKIIGFSVMSNHFHLLIKMESNESYTDEDILDRLEFYYKRELVLSKCEINKYRESLGDISNCIKFIKQKFSLWFNKVNNRKGHFWSDRFKSVLIESGESLLNCLAYIDLNSVRANLTELPEEYKWSSVYYRTKKNDHLSSLSFDGINTNSGCDFLSEYLMYLYFAGDITEKNRIKEKSIKNDNSFVIKRGVFSKKQNTFTNCMVMGSFNFIQTSYKMFGNSILTKNRKQAYNAEFSDNIYSVRRKYTQSVH